MDRVLDGVTTCLNFTLSDRATPDKIALAEGGTVLFQTRSIDTNSTVFQTRSIDTNSTVPSSASAILSGGARSLSVKFKHVVTPSSTRSMAERKGQFYADK